MTSAKSLKMSRRPIILLAALLASLSPVAAQPTLTHTISVPLDYEHPGEGRAQLAYEFGAPFDPRKPTVILVADGQQFYVQPGAAARLQHDLFGPDVNVVGLITRGTTPAFVKAALSPVGKADWLRAWHIFKSSQWIEDIEAVRKAVVGDRPAMLYGRSGGAYLVHQYLAVHGDHINRAFTQSAVNPLIARTLGIRLDRFWDALGQTDPGLRPVLLEALQRRPEERVRMLLALQRQHFFVPEDQEASERRRLIRAFAEGDETTYADLLKAYQVGDIMTLLSSNDAIPQNVRVLELIGPSGEFESPTAPVSPLIDPQKVFAGPLLELEHAHRIAEPAFDLGPAHRLRTEIFILAARQDEAVDYRTSIALAYAYPVHALFVANDNHTFLKLSSDGEDGRLLRAFFVDGLESSAFATELEAADSHRWRE